MKGVKEAHRPEAAVQVHLFAKIQLGGQLDPFRSPNVGKPHGSEKNRVRPAACLKGLIRQRFTAPPVFPGSGRKLLGFEADPLEQALHRPEDLNPLLHHFYADPISGKDGDAIKGGLATHRCLNVR